MTPVKEKEVIRCNRIGYKQTERMITNTMKVMTQVLIPSLGPFGSNTILEGEGLGHEITKDGFKLLTQIFFMNDGERIISDFVKKISQNQMMTVGDGTTSAVVLAGKLYEDLKIFKKTFSIPDNIMQEIIIDLKNEIIRMVRTETKLIEKFDYDKLYDIALVASNHSEKIAEVVRDAYKAVDFDGIVMPEKSLSENTSITQTTGYEIDRPLFNKLFATDKRERVCEFKGYKNKVGVVVFKGKMEAASLDLIGAIINREIIKKSEITHEPSPLAFVCTGIDMQVKMFFEKNIRDHGLPMVIISFPTLGQTNQENFIDLVSTLGVGYIDIEGQEQIPLIAEITNRYLDDHIAYVDTLYIDDRKTQFIGLNNNELTVKQRSDDLQEHLDHLASINDHIDRTMDINSVRSRIAHISGNIAKIYIGGKTQAEIDSKFYLLEDAVMAVKSAIETGYVPGGNLIVPYLINKNLLQSSTEGDKFKEALIAKFSYHLNSDKVTNLYRKVVNSYSYVFVKILNNFYGHSNSKDFSSLFDITESCIKEGRIINLMKNQALEDFEDTKIINSAKTEIEILDASASIVSLLLSSNQLIMHPSTYFRKELMEMKEMKKRMEKK